MYFSQASMVGFVKWQKWGGRYVLRQTFVAIGVFLLIFGLMRVKLADGTN